MGENSSLNIFVEQLISTEIKRFRFMVIILCFIIWWNYNYTVPVHLKHHFLIEVDPFIKQYSLFQCIIHILMFLKIVFCIISIRSLTNIFFFNNIFKYIFIVIIF